MITLIRRLLGLEKQPAPVTPTKQSNMFRLQQTCAHTSIANDRRKTRLPKSGR
ncbi:MAG: hypothetical protein K2R98_20725 [Gemmataceae bacterium]|nr:hypothetical protein [Gemmataceae bacterium]